MKYRIDYTEYELLNNEDSYSCIGHYDVHRNEEPKHELDDEIKRISSKYIEPVHKKILAGKLEFSTLTRKAAYMPNQSEDFGPQRFCNSCGVKLIEKWDSAEDKNVYYHPDTDDCGVDPDYEVTDDNMNCGIMNHEDMTKDDLRNVYRKLDKEGLEWMRNNKEYLRKLYVDHDDFAGKSELEVRPASYVDEDGNMVDPLENSEKCLADADSEIFNLTEFSKEEISIINYIAGGNGSNFRYSKYRKKWYATSGHAVILYNQYKCLQKLYAAYNEGGIRKHVMEHLLGCIFACYGIKCPNAERYTKYKNLRKWKQIEDAIRKEEAFLKQDWEHEARAQEAHVQHVYWF